MKNLNKPIACYVSARTRSRLFKEVDGLKASPWVFQSEVLKLRGDEDCGRVAVLYDHKNRQIGVGLYDPYSAITIRLLAVNERFAFNERSLLDRLESALQIRTCIIDSEKTNAYRVVHGEEDFLPGLVIDRYADDIVVKLYSLVWAPYLKVILAFVQKELQCTRVRLRLARLIVDDARRAFQLEDGAILFGDSVEDEVEYREDGVRYLANLRRGQKTGAFLDQRDNRKRVQTRSRGKRVLNVFAYTGGFSVSAAMGGAQHVVSVDQSQPALDIATRIFALNKNVLEEECSHETRCGDAFELMEQAARASEHYDMVIVDPPSFARSNEHLENAYEAYKGLARLALPLVRNGGEFVFASCTNRISRMQLGNFAHHVAHEEGYRLQELESYGHAVDHPITTQSGSYLKCIFFQVDASDRKSAS